MKVLPFLLLSLVVAIHGCGISTHTEIGHRGLAIFENINNNRTKIISDILKRHQDAFQAGHPFPDAFYNSLCYDGRYHQQSEDTHWGKYVQVGLDYINKNFPVWDEDTEKLIAFLFGIVSHQVADITWHSLQGLEDGFIAALAELNFDGNFGKAHDHADVGGDMVGVFEWNVTEYATEWYIPTQDLVNIYELYYGADNEMDGDLVDVCGGMLLVGRVGEQAIGQILYPEFARASPAMIDMYKDYYLGGLSDMATWTSLVWEEVTQALFTGTESCIIPENTLQISCKEGDTTEEMWYNKLGRNHKPKEVTYEDYILSTLYEGLQFTRTKRGVKISIREEVINNLLEETRLHLDTLVEENNSDDHNQISSFKTILELHGETEYQGLGHTLQLSDLDEDGVLDLISAAPGQYNRGCVHIYNGVLEDKFSLEKKIEICSPTIPGRFGQGIAVIDVNQDGVKDLVIGDPYFGAEDLAYTGRVHVYLGNITSGEYSVSLRQTIGSNISNSNFGEHLWSLDTDSDGEDDLLVVGAPMWDRQKGAVFMYRPQIASKGSTGGLIGDPDSDLLVLEAALYGQQQFGRFGSSVAYHNGLMAVGSPTFRVCQDTICANHDEMDLQSAGLVTIFDVDNMEQLLTIDGDQEMAGRGASLAFSNLTVHGEMQTVLAIGESASSSDGADLQQSGRVTIYTVHRQPDGVVVNQVSRLSGDQELGRFGAALEAGPGGAGLVIGAPLRGTVLASEGQVYFIDGTTDLPGGDVTSHCGISPAPCPEKWATLVLNPGWTSSWFGGALAIGTDPYFGDILVVGAERSSNGSRLAGSVAVYNL